MGSSMCIHDFNILKGKGWHTSFYTLVLPCLFFTEAEEVWKALEKTNDFFRRIRHNSSIHWPIERDSFWVDSQYLLKALPSSMIVDYLVIIQHAMKVKDNCAGLECLSLDGQLTKASWKKPFSVRPLVFGWVERVFGIECEYETVFADDNKPVRIKKILKYEKESLK
jgi:hypothetical protein